MREELAEFVEKGELSREEAEFYQEETVRMRMARLPHALSPDTLEPEEVYSRLKELVEEERLSQEVQAIVDRSPGRRPQLERHPARPRRSSGSPGAAEPPAPPKPLRRPTSTWPPA